MLSSTWEKAGRMSAMAISQHTRYHGVHKDYTSLDNKAWGERGIDGDNTLPWVHNLSAWRRKGPLLGSPILFF